jgi:hypothetical protein
VKNPPKNKSEFKKDDADKNEKQAKKKNKEEK